MSQRILLAGFNDEDDLLKATRLAREQGWHIKDVYTPCAVHGLDDAMGLPPSRLPWICFLFGLVGAVFAMWFQNWSLATDWPMNIGGRPFDSWPAYVPVAFEMMVLLAGFGVVFAFLARCRLYPGKKPQTPYPDVTDGRFVLVLHERSAAFDSGLVCELLQPFHPAFIEEREEEVAR